MAFRYQYNASGGDPVVESFPMAAVNVANGSIAYFNAAGFVTNAYTDADTVTTVLSLGAVAQAVDNSAGAAGALNLPVICTKDARYDADTTAAVAATDIGTNVTMDSILVVDENDPVTTSSGVVRQLRLQGATATVSRVLCSINFGTP